MMTRHISKLFVLLLTLGILWACNRSLENKQITVQPDSVYLKRGDAIATQTFDTLRNSLLRAVGERGMVNAIGFCHEQADSLTQTFADGISVRRTALRFRNETNKPDSLELVVLLEMERLISSGGKPKGQLVRQQFSNKVHYFKPIVLQPMCLSCHGKAGSEIQPATLASIQMLYPKDRATDFVVGDLRGAWHILFKE